MAIKNKVKNLICRYGDRFDKAIDKAGDIADKRTKGKYTEKIGKTRTQAKKVVERMGQDQTGQDRMSQDRMGR